MACVGYLAVGTVPCNSHVNYVTLKHLQIILFKYKAIHNFYLSTYFIYPHADCLQITYLNAANSQYAFKQHMHTKLQLYTLLNLFQINYYLALCNH